MLLRELMDERGLSSADVAALLEEHGVTLTQGERAGEPFRPIDVGRRVSREVPRGWLSALGLESPAPTGNERADGDAPDAPSQGRRRERAPKRPAEAAITIVEPGAAKRIAGAYRFAGAALAAGSGSQGVAHVWDDSADKIAELWLQAAQENPWAARFVTLMQAGGPMGDLAAGHLYLAGATLYVLGAGIPGGDAIFAKYSRFRPVVRPRSEENGRAETPEPEAAADAAESPVVDG
jgi:hypothetical protein